jgi:hypothetical protein
MHKVVKGKGPNGLIVYGAFSRDSGTLFLCLFTENHLRLKFAPKTDYERHVGPATRHQFLTYDTIAT